MPPRSTLSSSSAASDVYKEQLGLQAGTPDHEGGGRQGYRLARRVEVAQTLGLQAGSPYYEGVGRQTLGLQAGKA